MSKAAKLFEDAGDAFIANAEEKVRSNILSHNVQTKVSGNLLLFAVDLSKTAMGEGPSGPEPLVSAKGNPTVATYQSPRGFTIGDDAYFVKVHVTKITQKADRSKPRVSSAEVNARTVELILESQRAMAEQNAKMAEMLAKLNK